MQARYIVERMDTDLWAKVLDEDNAFRRQLIDQVSLKVPPRLNCYLDASRLVMISLSSVGWVLACWSAAVRRRVIWMKLPLGNKS